MFFDSKKRQEKREAKRKERLYQEAVKKDPLFQDRLNRNHEIMMDSIRILNDTRNLVTFTGRYSDAKSAAFRLETAFLQIGDDCCQGIQGEIDALFMERLPAVLDLELAQADTLKTLSGKRKRWNGIVQTLEKCERVSGSAVEDAITEAEAKVFLLLEEGTDWSKEPVDIDFGPSEAVVVESLKKAALKTAIERGIPEDQARDIIEKTIRNKKSGQG